MDSRIYLDYNATTPLHPKLADYVTQNLSKFGNPSSVHWAGREAKKLITQARSNLAQFLNGHPLEIVFTSSGSEANNMAIKNSLPLIAGERNEILYSAVEHPSVIKSVLSMKERGYRLIEIPVKSTGSLDLDFYKMQLCKKTALVTVQLVNNETGNIFPVKEIAEHAHKVGALVHSDMVQALGKIPVDVKDLGVDLATFAGHKFYSLKGAAVLFVKSGTHLTSLISGGGQERSRRAGTENALAIGSLGQAVALLGSSVLTESKRLSELRGQLESEILRLYPDFKINGLECPRVPNTLNVYCPQIDGETLLINLDTRGVAVSSGAACSSGSQEPSPVLRAMGLTSTQAQQSLRISLGYLTTAAEVSEFLERLKSAINHMKEVKQAEVCG